MKENSNETQAAQRPPPCGKSYQPSYPKENEELLSKATPDCQGQHYSTRGAQEVWKRSWGSSQGKSRGLSIKKSTIQDEGSDVCSAERHAFGPKPTKKGRRRKNRAKPLLACYQ